MASRDLHNIIKNYSALNSTSITSSTTTNGNIIDSNGYEGVEFLLQAGAMTDGTYTPSIFAGNASDLSDGVTVPAQFLIGTTNVIDTLANQRPDYGSPIVDAIGDATFTGATDSNKVKRIGTNAPYRYFRLVITSTSVTTGGTLAAIALLGWAHANPTPKD